MKGGKTLNDRILAAEVRTLTLKKIKALLEMPEVKMKQDDYELYKAVLIKLAGNVLPRLNEHTGEDGGDLVAKVILLPERKNETDNTLASEQGQTDDSPASQS